MTKSSAGPLTVVQHLLHARVKLIGIHARLEQFGTAAGEDPMALERVETAQASIMGALDALSAIDPHPEPLDVPLPF